MRSKSVQDFVNSSNNFIRSKITKEKSPAAQDIRPAPMHNLGDIHHLTQIPKKQLKLSCDDSIRTKTYDKKRSDLFSNPYGCCREASRGQMFLRDRFKKLQLLIH
jgi:hypothetical protein